MMVGSEGSLHEVTDATLWSLGRRCAWPPELAAWAIGYVLTRKRATRPSANPLSRTRAKTFIVVPPAAYNELEEVLSKRSMYTRNEKGRNKVEHSEFVVSFWVESARPVSHRTMVAVMGSPSN